MKSTEDSFKKFVLPNGLTVLLFKMESIRSAYAELLVRVGCVNEKASEEGISHLVEHLGTLSTQKFQTKLAIANYAKGIGASHNAFTNRFATGYWVKLPSENLLKGLQLIDEFVFHPKLDSDIENERKVILSEINDRLGNPEKKFWFDFWQKRFKTKDHPYGRIAFGTAETVEKMDLKAVLKWRDIYYKPGNMILSITGNFEFEPIEEQVKKFFGVKGGKTEVKKPVFSMNDYSDHLSMFGDDTRDQISTSILFPAFGRNSVTRRKIMELAVINSVLSHGPSSRIFQLLRERKGLIYDVWGSYTVYDYLGVLEINSSASRKNVYKVFDGIRNEINKFLSEGISQEELDLAIKSANYGIEMKFDNPVDIASYISNEVFDYGEIWFPEKYIKESKKITTEEVNKLAREIFDFSKVNIGVFGSVDPKTKEDIGKLYSI